MGLDLTLVASKKELTWDNLEDEDTVELAYGRKAWEICHWFDASADPDYRSISLEKWNEFIELLKPIGDKLDAIWDAFYRFDNLPDDFSDYLLIDEDKRLIAEYKFWYNATWNDTPTLGYLFSVGYMKEFWEADARVRDYIADGYNIYIFASY